MVVVVAVVVVVNWDAEARIVMQGCALMRYKTAIQGAVGRLVDEAVTLDAEAKRRPGWRRQVRRVDLVLAEALAEAEAEAKVASWMPQRGTGWNEGEGQGRAGTCFMLAAYRALWALRAGCERGRDGSWEMGAGPGVERTQWSGCQ